MFKTLHSKLLLFFLLVSVLPVIMVGYISYQSEKEALIQQFESNLFILAENLSVEIEQFVSERFADTTLLAEDPVLSDTKAATEDIRTVLNYFEDVYKTYDGSVFVSKEGTVIVDTNITAEGKNLSERPWFQSAIQGGTFLSDIYFSPVVYRPLLVLAAPVKNRNNEIIGVVSPSIDLTYLWRTIERFSEQRKNMGLSGYAFIINSKGYIVTHPDRSEIFYKNFLAANNLNIKSLSEFYQNKKLYHSGDQETVNAFAALNPVQNFNNEWFVGISVPEKDLYAPLQKLVVRYWLTLGFIILIIILLTITLSQSIVNPIQQLVLAVSDLGAGKKISPLKVENYDEIGKLTNSFNNMAAKLEEREKFHKKSTIILETVDKGVLAIDKNQVITIFNNKCEELFKIQKEYVIGKNIKEISNQLSDFKVFIERSTIIESLNENISTKKLEFEITLTGQQFSFLTYISSLPSLDNENNPEGIVVIFSDITEKRLMERGLVRSEKLKVAGELAAGVAHEIRNPMTTIRGFLQLLDSRKNDNGSEKEYFQIMIQELDRINKIITDFLTLAKSDSVSTFSETDIHEVLDETLTLQEPQALLKDIFIVRDYEFIPAIYLDPKQLKQVFINIINNALDAIPAGGKLEITTRFLENEEAISIAFNDTGCGIDKQTLDKLGTPFFTTKDTGTGIGLMLCYRIIENMNGTLTAESEVDAGTTFMIKLPIKQ